MNGIKGVEKRETTTVTHGTITEDKQNRSVSIQLKTRSEQGLRLEIYILKNKVKSWSLLAGGGRQNNIDLDPNSRCR